MNNNNKICELWFTYLLARFADFIDNALNLLPCNRVKFPRSQIGSVYDQYLAGAVELEGESSSICAAVIA